jgi:ABC-type antimicrobial peptide transport system permease subunit
LAAKAGATYGFLNLSARIREFGVLRALGVQSGQIRQLVVYESLLLSLPPILLAAVIGYGITGYYELHPIVIEGMAEAYKEYGIVSDTIPMRCDLFTIGWSALTVFGLNLLGIVYPLYYIKGFTPVEAMRHV